MNKRINKFTESMGTLRDMDKSRGRKFLKGKRNSSESGSRMNLGCILKMKKRFRGDLTLECR